MLQAFYSAKLYYILSIYIKYFVIKSIFYFFIFVANIL